MKKQILISLILIGSALTLNAQWLTNENNIYYNLGRVGIGITNPNSKFEVGVTHAYNQDEEMRIGSYFNNKFYGLGLNYRIDASGSPSNYIIDYSGGTRYTAITLSNNKVGIGIMSPSFKLDVQSSSDNAATVVSRDAAGGISSFMFVNSNGSGSIYARGADNSTNTVVINGGGSSYFNGGNVGIGTTSPLNLLDIKASASNQSLLRLSTFASPTAAGFALGFGNTFGADEGAIVGKVQYSNTYYDVFAINRANRNFSFLNGNIGIGTTSPSFKLDVRSSSDNTATVVSRDAAGGISSFMFVNSDGSGSIYTRGADNSTNTVVINGAGRSYFNGGNIGIGTTSPKEKLDVRGDCYINSGVDDNHIYWGLHYMTMGTKPGDYCHNYFSLKPGGSSSGKLYSIFRMYNANSETDHELKVQIHTNGVTFFNGGNVGIGTTDPQNKLDVLGTIRATEVKVEAPWADFVFQPAYKLRTLGEVEQYIKANNHLPDVPSEAEVKENGVSLGEMNAKLLQKVEELTLYMIEMKKENEALKKRIEILENK